MDAKKKIALVTGSSRGIGAATAIKLAEDGCDVAINYLSNSEAAESVLKKIESLGQKAVAIQADISDFEHVQTLVSQAVNALGGLNILVNNAGYSAHGTLDVLTTEDWRKMMASTLDAAFYCAKCSLPHMKDSGWGKIVNVSSLRAMTGSDHSSHYASAKAGLIGFTKSLALELAPEITVNAVSPGYTATDMNAKSIAEKGDQIRAKVPLNHIAEPEEIADVIAFLCSDKSSYVTGETINVNGGIYMR
jgi:3-oxoacyl-[acyl-carrier protein] reductase